MVHSRLLRKIKDEIADLRRENSNLKDENSRLWKVIRALLQSLLQQGFGE